MLSIIELKKKWGIGLTGGIASGKSTVANILRQAGRNVIDADELSHEAVAINSLGYKKVVKTFGPQVLAQDGAIDRKVLAGIVFADENQKKRLEDIIHPIIQEFLAVYLSNFNLYAKPKIWFYEASLIYETNLQEQFREIWVTYCPREVQLERLMAHRRMDRTLAEKILAVQLPGEEKAKRAHHVLDTNVDFAILRDEVLRLLASKNFS